MWSGLFDTFIFIFILGISWGSVYLADRSRGGVARQFFLMAGIVVMSFHLFFWKYMPWIGSTIQEVKPSFLGGQEIHLPLPVGISFFTLQGIAYLIDYGRGDAKYVSIKDYFLFKSFFPQLIAGPITRMRQIGHQLQNLPEIYWENIRDGLLLFAIGFFKKIAIADRMSYIADPVFRDPSNYSAGSILWAIIAYTVQIWGDFSGYTDMGRGTAKMFGIKLPENFYAPYFSRSPSEFWRRWHVTLSQWIRDYIYIPLGGGDGTAARITMVLILTMTMSGLWHGAAFTFFLWGIYHGILLVLERTTSLFQGVFSTFLTLILIMFGWLIFRSESLQSLLDALLILFGQASGGQLTISRSYIILGVASCFFFHLFTYKSFDSSHSKLQLKILSKIRYFNPTTFFLSILSSLLISFIIILALIFRVTNSSSQFIYFQF